MTDEIQQDLKKLKGHYSNATTLELILEIKRLKKELKNSNRGAKVNTIINESLARQVNKYKDIVTQMNRLVQKASEVTWGHNGL